MRRAGGLVCALLCIFVLFAGAAGSDFYVQDEAGVLSDETYRFIMRTAPALEQQAEGAQIVVLTVPTTGGMDEAEFALERARTVGDAEKTNGVLILLVTGDRKVRVEVGYGLEGALPDGKVGRLIDERALDYYKNNDFDRGTLELYKGVLSAVMREYGIEELADYRAEDEPNRIWESVGAIVLLILILVLFMGRRGRGPWVFFHSGPHFYGGSGGFSGGGGGGGFSGGGGSFGGGSAGRSF